MSSNNFPKKIFPAKISKKQASDTGMAMVLLLLLIGFFTGNDLFYKIAIPVLALNMTWPNFFKPFAVVWLGLSHLLGTVMSKILLSLVFFLLVTPMGVIRRWLGKDPLQLRAFKRSDRSVLKERNHNFTSEDLEAPF